MFNSKIKVLLSHGKQYIKDLDRVELPSSFRGRIHILREPSPEESVDIVNLCPSKAITCDPLCIDLGQCLFCNECTLRYPHLAQFSSDHKIATNDRERLKITASSEDTISVDVTKIRSEIKSLFGRALKLRQVSAGGDNSTEMELNASMNVNFDFSRYGIDFVASPRHADGIVITGPISSNMAESLEICYNAVPSPKIIILAGTDAISGGLFAESLAVNRSFLDRHSVDLYVPGNPVHPLTFIDGVLKLTRQRIKNNIK